ncbi:JmjC domain-containing protein [Actinokineospora sp.]|uniref:JmjC domain-containing protein n=1 Tax=Actinokineospora sp. TaxID=1872133 RepID=UPI00403760A1
MSEKGDLVRAYHGTEPLLLRQAVPLAGLPTSADLDGLIDASLLRWPYFTVFQDGVKPPLTEVTTSRRVGGAEIDGFVRPAGVRTQLAEGATFKLSQVEDWHNVIRDQVEELRAIFPAEVTSYLFLTPKGKRGMLPHRDGSRVLVIQIEGAKEWHLYYSAETENPDAGLDVDPSTELDTVVLTPGDVLYLPHAYAHAPRALDETSLHVTFTLTEPTPESLLSALLDEWLATDRMSALVDHRDTLTTAEQVDLVVAELKKFAQDVDPSTLLTRALASAAFRDES